MIPGLIDKQDTFEIVRDKVAVILANEVVNQMALADAGGKDQSLWKLRIFAERSAPWEQFLNAPVTDKSPLVNVWYESSNFVEGKSDPLSRQYADGVINIDCYGYGVASDDSGGGHNPGDKEAAFAVHRALRLVRNILMATEYKYLELQGVVWKRWIRSSTIFQPSNEGVLVQNVVGARIALQVGFNERSPEFTGVDLDEIRVDVHRTEDGEIVAQAQYDLT